MVVCGLWQAMTFEVTNSPSIVKYIITHPKVYGRITDDYCENPPVDFRPMMQEPVRYVIVMDGQELMGGFMLVPDSRICWQIHAMLLPKSWGRTRQIAREMAEWFWSNTSCLRLYTSVAAYNSVAIVFAKYAGFTEFGRNKKSFMKRGRLQDQILLGLSKPEVV